MKGMTDIPFMADAVKLVWGRGAATALGKRYLDEVFFKRLMHFEARYKSVDSLLNEISGLNILEISSGFSFRGLDRVLKYPDLTYIDTDLPNVIADKDDLIGRLIDDQSLNLQGELMMMPLNVFDEASFFKTSDHFPPGPVSIINEGLLMYLNIDEKKQLCKIIHQVLSQRGGHWITADIYVKKGEIMQVDDAVSQFLKAHNVEENKFDSFDQAEAFFAEQGFKIVKKAESAGRELSSLKYIPAHAVEGLIQQAGKIGRIRETWALSVI